MTEYLWYVARGSGLVSLLLLTGVVLLGIVHRSGRPLPGLPRFAIGTVHRNVALLAVVFVGMHILTLLADPYAQLHLINLVVPFTAAYRPLWTGLGSVTLDLVLALIVTGLLRHRLGQRTFRLLHWLAYLAWPAAVAHGLGSGTDVGQFWLTGTAIACIVAVGGAVIWRTGASFSEVARARVPVPPVVPPPTITTKGPR
jgi:sulfoxide reductase heme-binding subunit YedZ